MVPPAPPLFSTMNGWPRSAESFAPRRHAGRGEPSKSPLLPEPVARELRLVERDAETRTRRKREDARPEVEFFGGDVVHGLERPDAFQPVDHVRAGRGKHDLRHGVYAEPESVAYHAADSRGFGGGERGGGAVESALLHDFQFDD